MAINAIIQLYRAIPPTTEEDGKTTPRVQELDRQILAFSISRDNDCAKLYGHYAVIEGDKTSLYRHPICHLALNFCCGGGNDRWQIYQFVRSVYADFAPAHLQRIKSAIAHLPEPPAHASGAADEVSQQEGIAPSVPSSQDDSVFKQPALPLSVQLQQDNDRLEEQLRARDGEMEKLKEQVKKLLDKGTTKETT
ncbi:MAG: hypothetical protein L6R41_002987 [Letrouitia leprolyta]|nr:MAG: hypothetical protein L6R41_002987 [Letrouitia leprolyta]